LEERGGEQVDRQYTSCSVVVLALKRPMATICFWFADFSHSGACRLFSTSRRDGPAGGRDDLGVEVVVVWVVGGFLFRGSGFGEGVFVA